MSLEMNGLSDLQKDLLEIAFKKLPKEKKKVMRKAGNKAKSHVAKQARKKVDKKDNVYHKKWKRGKVFDNAQKQTVVRVINSAPHAHLIEDGHRKVIQNGRTLKSGQYVEYKNAGQEIGFVPGRKVLDQGMRDFENSGQYTQILSDWIDDMLKDGKL